MVFSMNVFKNKNVGKINDVKNVKKRALNKKRKNVFFTSMAVTVPITNTLDRFASSEFPAVPACNVGLF